MQIITSDPKVFLFLNIVHFLVFDQNFVVQYLTTCENYNVVVSAKSHCDPDLPSQDMNTSVLSVRHVVFVPFVTNVSQHYQVVLGVVFDKENHKKLFTSAEKSWNQ